MSEPRYVEGEDTLRCQGVGVFRAPCFCKGRRYRCPGCLRFIPWCLGAADELWEFCDDCHAHMIEHPKLVEHFRRYQAEKGAA